MSTDETVTVSDQADSVPVPIPWSIVQVETVTERLLNEMLVEVRAMRKDLDRINERQQMERGRGR